MSDFLEDVDLSLLSQKHEVIAVILRDREEEVPKKLGEVTLSHPQDAKKMDTYFGQRSIEKYLAKLKENDEKLAEHFARYDIRSVKIFTDDEVVSKLVGLFVLRVIFENSHYFNNILITFICIEFKFILHFHNTLITRSICFFQTFCNFCLFFFFSDIILLKDLFSPTQRPSSSAITSSEMTSIASSCSFAS